jgi:hypothetical protein
MTNTMHNSAETVTRHLLFVRRHDSLLVNEYGRLLHAGTLQNAYRAIRLHPAQGTSGKSLLFLWARSDRGDDNRELAMDSDASPCSRAWTKIALRHDTGEAIVVRGALDKRGFT